MKGTLLLLLCAITVQAAQPQLTARGTICHCNAGEAASVCSKNGSNNELIVHENCNQFYKCSNGQAIPYFCPDTTLYNPLEEICDWPQNVQCGARPIVSPDNGGAGNENSSQEGSNEVQDNGDNGNGGTCNCNAEEAPALCAAVGSDGVLVIHQNCNQFYICNHGLPVTLNCPPGLLYNAYKEQCDWPHNVECGDRPIVEIEGGGDNDDDVDCEDGGDGNGESGGGDNGGTCNCNPGEAPAICAVDGSEGVMVAHENCNKFYMCNHGLPVSVNCPSGLLYNPFTELCDWPHNVECGDRHIVETEGGGNGDNGSGGGSGDSGGTCNCNPGEAPGICAVDGSDGTLIAHENCNQFYKCDNRLPVTINCPAGLVYNPYSECCDWPANVDCGDKSIVEIEDGGNGDNGNEDNSSGGGNGDNGGGDNGGSCNCKPDEAPKICAADGSDGTLIAHENCNQFYKCDNGLPVTMSCPAGLVYNPYIECCDWPANVDCGEKPIIDIDGGGDGDNGSGGGSSDNGSGGGSAGENSNEENGGTCNCNPDEAPGICAVDGSDGTCIAHENCNQYYTCVHGTPVAMNCPAGLAYNPYIERCDWPYNVDCGDKPIIEIDGGGNGDNGGGDNGSGDNGSGGDNGGTCNCNPVEAPGICATDGSDGTLIAHDNCNQFYKCSNGLPVPMNCPLGLVYNPYIERCDWPANVDCGDKPIVEIDCGGNGDNGGGDNGSGDNGSGGDNGGTCNCNPDEAPGICAIDGSDGILIAHDNCNQFYKCSNGLPVPMNCPLGLVYNPYIQRCDWPANVDCGDKPIVEIDCGGNGDNGSGGGNGDNGSGGGSAGGNSNEDNGGACNCNPDEAPGICAVDGSEGFLIAHENCNQFYKCSNGVPVSMCCPAGLVYNPHIESCDWPANVDCGDRPIVDNDEGDNGGTDNGGTDNGGTDNGGTDNGGGTCNCNPGEAPGICAVDGSEGVLIAHENCNQFYKCSNGVPVSMNCPAGLVYNPHIESCDWPANVDCGDRPIVDIDEGDNGGTDNGGTDNGGTDNGGTDNGGGTCNCNPGEAPGICAVNGSEGVLIAHENCNQFYMCSNGVPVSMNCPAGLVYNPHIESCDWPANVDCGDRPIVDIDEGDNGGTDNGGTDNGGTDNGGGTCNCNPGEAPGICAADGSEGVLISHENCNQFYKCSNGVPVSMNCPAGLVYNPHIESCDWPANVDCGDRPIVDIDEGDNGGTDNGGTDNGGTDNGGGTCNCNPDEAPGICAVDGSEGVLIAHENCNQFYMCSNGVPVSMNCPAGLVYNPHIESCDWPANVDCGDRPIVDIDGGDNGGTDNGGTDNGNGNGTCNCNPDEAPGICAVDGSEGILIAHENCNQFYKCSNGVPVSMNCPAGLVYNPHIESCDWPANVDCGDRPIVDIDEGDNGGTDNGGTDNGGTDNGGGTCNCNPDEAPGICAVDGSEGVLIAHENCNQFYMCSNGVPVSMNCPAGLVYNPHIESCDWPANVDCGDRPIVDIDEGDNGGTDNEGTDNGGTDIGGTDNGGGTCNCNPGEAPGICAVDGSEGVLIAHENCNQFYMCSNGVPVSMNCPAGLVYNPHIESCDWPANVDCGDRPIVDIDEGDNGGTDNGGTDNGGTDNGGTDNGGGTCNCNPGEAPGICAADGSEGVLIAHENCNQFYKCSNGVPVSMNCPAGLVYNPHIESCDWPANVDCGDRPIVDIDEGDNGGTDNGGTDNGGTDNGGGTCNCNPGEAPGICAVDGSEGVLIAHENCNQFYKCSNGVHVSMNCPAGLVYNPHIESCDWPANVDCGDRPIVDIDEGDNGGTDNGGTDNGGTDNGGTDNGGGTCNCNPGEAPGICAVDGSEGVLIAHENCNQFYKCSNGVPISMNCPAGLVYNPHIESCDWPANVDCGDRPIVDIDEGDNGGTDNGGTDNGGSDNGGTDNGGTDNGGTDNGGGTCNCNPGEAPGICAVDGSEGVLIAHENCNQFYKCSNRVPVSMNCPAGLVYNPHIESCDWPANVDCGDRPIVDIDEGDNGGTDNGGTDNGGTDNGGTDNGGGTCNCNPGEAPGICAVDGSEGVLIAHENCNQFYKCSNGVPVSMNCPAGLVYNPHIESCDWPANVDCGDRPIVDIDEGDNLGTDNGGTDNGSADNGGGTCNCNPGEAPGICQAPGSDNVLIAHENCNQFYICTNGVPVPLSCHEGLYYNPYTQRCDWLANVKCGDRDIAGVDDESEDSNGNGDGSSDNGSSDNGSSNNESSDNESSDNGSSDNENSDNGNSDSSCDCSEEVASICASADSQGLHVIHENCNQFYICSHGIPVCRFCPVGTLFHPLLLLCDWPDRVECGDRPIVEYEEGNEDKGDTDEGGSDNQGTCNCNPNEAPTICAAAGSDNTLVAHENCNQFYMCAHGLPVALFCSANLLYDPYTERCNWPANVDCGDRPIVDVEEGGNGDSGGTDGEDDINVPCDPSQAPAICAAPGSNGILVCHENCDKFYVCTNGAPVTMECPSNLLYNPDIRDCDWPSNVDCGDRVISESGDNGGECACNAREAPSICAGSDSNGKLVAHENCNQYYVCFEGSPVARSCPQTLFYEPKTEQCLWPTSVNCDGRTVSSYSSLNKHTQARRGFF